MDILRFDLQAYLEKQWKERKKSFLLFSVLFLCAVLIYGQKLFFYMLPSDDYMRFWGDTNTKMLITNSARWAQALLNDYVFTGKLQILPYLHSLFGIAAFVWMGFLTARFWKCDTAFSTAMATLLIAVNPMFAHNLLFSTNITAWLTLALALYAFVAAYERGWFAKAVAFVLMVFAIANYQTILQVVSVMLFFLFLEDMLAARDMRDIRKALWRISGWFIFLFAAYAVSFGINEIFMKMHHFHETHRLAQAEHVRIETVIKRLTRIYTVFIDFDHFKKTFAVLYGTMAFMAYAGYVYALLRKHVNGLTKMTVWFLATAVFAVMPVVLNLPYILGVDIPLRAHFTAGWVLAGAFMLHRRTLPGILRSFSMLLSIAVLIVSIYAITLFFDAAYRQTQADILRANMVVERIRTSPGYEKEPIGFRIIGQANHAVKGFDLKWQQPFDSYWARYPVFRHFTDLKFHAVSPAMMHEIEAYIFEHYDHIDPYPGKNSIIVYKNNAVLFLNPYRINAALKRRKYLSRMPKRMPDVKSVFDIFIEKGVVYYKKTQCTEEDVRNRFFLRVYPVAEEKRTNLKGVRIKPFQKMDFHFSLYGERKNGVCTAAVKLPEGYRIDRIRTGQFDGKGGLKWDITYKLHQ
jgi:hypothetical protein